MVNQVNVRPPKVTILQNVPPLDRAQEGDLYYDITNNRLALRTSGGWVTFAKD